MLLLSTTYKKEDKAASCRLSRGYGIAIGKFGGGIAGPVFAASSGDLQEGWEQEGWLTRDG
jgi:hypothetical protein